MAALSKPDFNLLNMESISIRLRSDCEVVTLKFSYCDLLYARIRTRFRSNNKKFKNYLNVDDLPQFVLYYKGKPLPERPVHFSQLDVKSGDTIEMIIYGLQGGVSTSSIDSLEILDIPPNVSFWYNNSLIQVDYIQEMSIQAAFTSFGCELFEQRLVEPSRFGVISGCLKKIGDRDYDDLDWALWPCPISSFRGYIIMIKYEVLQSSWQFREGVHYSWPESDFEDFDNDDNSSNYESDVDPDGSIASTDVSESNISDVDEDNMRDLSLETQRQLNFFREQSGVLPKITSLHILRHLTDIHNTIYSEDYVKKLIEDILILVNGLHKSISVDRVDFPGIITIIITFLKLRSNKSILTMFCDSKISDYIKELLKPTEESGIADALDSASNIIGAIKQGKKLKVSKVLYRLGMFALSLSLFESVGINLDLLGYSAFDKVLMRKKHKLTGDLVLDLAEGFVFLLKKGYQIILTGQFDCLYHTDDDYSKLHEDVLDLKMKKIALNNPEALGFNEYWYGDKLDTTMQKLRNLIKFANDLDKNEIRYWRNQLCELELIKNNILIAQNCAKSRECPFSLMFFASPGVGKSTLTKLTFQHLAKTHDLPTDDKFMYIRNPMAKFTDGFKSEMHTFLLDDISFKSPKANPNGDISLDEVYMLHGTFPYVPDQAAVEDKGRIPVRIKFLLGTTNVKDLNAFHYFSVPSAMQRRIPYVIDVKVKDQYQKGDGSGMLDAAKADCLPDEYPNYWILTVYKVAVPKVLGELAAMNELHKFTDINDFTAWLSTTSKEHFANERVMTNSFTNMRTVPICKACYKNTKVCSCPIEQSGSYVDNTLSWFCYYLALFLYYLYRHLAFILCSRTYWQIRNRFESYLEQWDYRCINEFVRRKKLLDIAHSARRRIGYPEVFGIIATTILAFYALFKFRRTIAGLSFTEQTNSNFSEATNTDPRPPVPGPNEKGVTWTVNDKKLSTIDLTPQILSSAQHSREDFSKLISRNVVRIIIYDREEPSKKYINNALVIKSNILFCNAHFFKNITKDKFQMILICDELGDGVNDRIEFSFSKSRIFFDHIRDLAVFVAHSLVPRKDLTKYFAKRGVFTEATGTLVGRDPRTGCPQFNTVHGITLQNNYSDDWGSHHYSGPVTFGKSVITTIDGDCGSVLIAHSPKGHFIVSLHRAGNVDNIVIGILLYSDDIDKYLNSVVCLAVSAGYPKLAENHTLQSLHPKSVFNYIENGSAIVYGSISDYKTNQRTRVCATPMRDYLVKNEGYPVDYGAPQLKGYMPHFLAARDLVSPTTQFDEDLLFTCAQSFLQDVLQRIPADDIKNMVHKYDLFTVVNGAEGVAFVDSINRSSSTGYPHCTSKRKYLEALPPQNGLQDPVKFTDEFYVEIERMLNEYKEGRRVHAVFKSTLKDEAVSHEKRKMGKTRVFGSAPVCYILIQRLYFLSCVRLIQTHKMAFECAVGVIATTREWELFYNKLNRFPNKIAGDFKKFDKQMCPLVILLAYWVLIQINIFSGNFNQEDILVMNGIATDTAYPFTLFNGDFVQFFGSNPSGQSLTVIINSIVNCLYLRYVYVKLYREYEGQDLTDLQIAQTFKDHVELFVYGDDNEASTDKLWYNFKNIQRVFSEVDITYTPPTKDDTSYNFMTIEEVDFLKRTYRYDPDLKAIVAPLSTDSLNKMLTTWVASDSVSPEVQGLATIASAIREYFFHGREIFEYKRNMFIRLLEHLHWEHGINTTILPTYEMLVEKYNENSDVILARLPQHSFELQTFMGC